MAKSWLGFSCTLALLGIVIAIFASQLVSIIGRESLTVSIAEEGVENPAATSLKSVTMAFGVMQRAAPLVSLTHDVDFNIQASLVTVTFFGSNPRQLSQVKENITIGRCDEDYFGDMLDAAEKLININDIYCIPRNTSEDLMTIEGKVGSETFKFIDISIRCGNSTATSCPSTFITSNVFFMYGASFLNVSNYEDPIKLTPTAIQDRADAFSYHEKSIYITPREIVTDQGLAFSSYNTETDIIVSEGASIVEAINVMTPAVFSFQIKMSPSKIVVNRSYKNILDVLASVTGIASTITLVLGILLKPYAEELIHTKIMKSLSPSQHKDLTVTDSVKALFGNKTARQKLKKRREEREWIIKNMDVIEMLKNWNDLHKLRKLTLHEPLPSLGEIKNSGVKITERTSLIVSSDIESGNIPNIPPKELSIRNEPMPSLQEVKYSGFRNTERTALISAISPTDIELGTIPPKEQISTKDEPLPSLLEVKGGGVGSNERIELITPAGTDIELGNIPSKGQISAKAEKVEP